MDFELTLKRMADKGYVVIISRLDGCWDVRGWLSESAMQEMDGSKCLVCLRYINLLQAIHQIESDLNRYSEIIGK